MATAAPSATGRVIQITGPVVDIEFPAGGLPAIFNAVEIIRDGQPPLVCEVQQHLGNNWVRAVAMTTTDGLARGTAVADTGAPISVPVGEVTLGRVFDVLGHPIDGRGPVTGGETLPIHRKPPSFEDQTTEVIGHWRYAGSGFSRMTDFLFAQSGRHSALIAVDELRQHRRQPTALVAA